MPCFIKEDMNEYDVTMCVGSPGLIMEYLRQMAVTSEDNVVMKLSIFFYASLALQLRTLQIKSFKLS
jgi:hypothetical protein